MIRFNDTGRMIVFLSCACLGSCQRETSGSLTRKIAFDITTIDRQGLDKGNVYVDYEYCIPAEEEKADVIRKIDPEVVIHESGKGRIGCARNEWLCISSTNGENWKDELFSIAKMPYIVRIERTYYE